MAMMMLFRSLVLSILFVCITACDESNGVFEEASTGDTPGSTNTAAITADSGNTGNATDTDDIGADVDTDGTNESGNTDADTNTDNTGTSDDTAGSDDTGSAVSTAGTVESGNTDATGDTDSAGGTDANGDTDDAGDSDELETADTTGGVENMPEMDVNTEQTLPPELLDNGRGPVYSLAVNSALLTGAVVGTGEIPNSRTYKSIQYSTQNIPGDMQILNALVFEFELGITFMTLHLRNASDEFRCFVEHGMVEVFNAGGQFVSAGFLEDVFVSGSLGIVPNVNTGADIYTDTCVSPGEIVYFLGLFEEDLALDQIESVKISDLTFNSNATIADIAVQPVSYEVGDMGINVLIANRSSRQIQLSNSKLFYLTDDGVPIYFSFTSHNDILQPGAELTISHAFPFRGSSTKLRVLLDYDPVE